MERRRYRPCLGGGCLPAGTCRKPPCLGLVELPPVPYSSRVLHSLTPPLLAAPPNVSLLKPQLSISFSLSSSSRESQMLAKSSLQQMQKPLSGNQSTGKRVTRSIRMR